MAINIKGIEFVPAKAPSASSGGRRAYQSDVTFGTGATARDGHIEYTMRIGLAQSFAKLARFRKGERFDVHFAVREKIGMIIKADNGRFRLLGGDGNARLELKTVICDDDNIPFSSQTVECESEIGKDGSVIFLLPDCVSFDRNLRAEADGKK
jgi:hypothetical protein